MSARVRWIVNFAVFQIGWFACVLGGAHGLPLLGTGFAVLGVALHVRLARAPRAELTMIALVAVIGGSWDSAVVSLGLMDYTSGQIAPGLTAHWLVALWALFATTFNSSLSWLRGWWLPIAMGAIGGPLSYLAGYKLGAATMPDVYLALAVQGLGWAALMPLCCRLAAHFDTAAPERSDTPRPYEPDVDMR